MTRRDWVILGIGGLVAAAVLGRLGLDYSRGITRTYLSGIEVGDCFWMPEDTRFRDGNVAVVECDIEHDSQVFAIANVPQIEEDELLTYCDDLWLRTAPAIELPFNAEMHVLWDPLDGIGTDDMTINCAIRFPDGLVGSILPSA